MLLNPLRAASQHFRLWKSRSFLTKAQNRYILYPDKWLTGEDTHLLHRAAPGTTLEQSRRTVLERGFCSSSQDCLPSWRNLGSPESSQHTPDHLLLNSPTVNKRLEHTPDALCGKPELTASPHLIQLVSPKAHSNSALGWQQITALQHPLLPGATQPCPAWMRTFTYLGGEAGGV